MSCPPSMDLLSNSTHCEIWTRRRERNLSFFVHFGAFSQSILFELVWIDSNSELEVDIHFVSPHKYLCGTVKICELKSWSSWQQSPSFASVLPIDSMRSYPAILTLLGIAISLSLAEAQFVPAVPYSWYAKYQIEWDGLPTVNVGTIPRWTQLHLNYESQFF